MRKFHNYKKKRHTQSYLNKNQNIFRIPTKIKVTYFTRIKPSTPTKYKLVEVYF